MQLRLFAQAAGKTRKGTDGEAGRSLLRPALLPAAKRADKRRKALPAIAIEEVADERNLREAFQSVATNKGAPGIDGETIRALTERLTEVLPALSRALQEETYRPGEIRRVWIPKAGGGERGLGIPNVIDRLVQQAVLQVMQPHYDPTFDGSSHGFRPGRSCHTAIAEAKTYVEDGYEYVVDIDLEKFFDTVHHQRLHSILERKIACRRVLKLIKLMLKAKVVLPNGVVVANEEGTPQGGPLSPLLSNIVLSELDEKLRERGHKFVRYADDCNIYVRSEAAGKRVLESTTRFIEQRLRLKVNKAKSAVARTGERHFLGFSLEVDPVSGQVHERLSARSKQRINERIRQLTPRLGGGRLETTIERLNTYLKGWIEFFKTCSEAENRTLERLDAHIRRRLRAIQLKQWKRRKTIVKRLIPLGASPKAAWRGIYDGRKSIWRLSHIPVVDRALRNAHFASRGLVSLRKRWQELQPKPIVQMSLTFGCA